MKLFNTLFHSNVLYCLSVIYTRSSLALSLVVGYKDKMDSKLNA